MLFTYLKQLMIVVLLCFSMANKLTATHIVGGDLTYKHIANDSFELTLILYIDCINGSLFAIADDSLAMLGIFDTSGTLKSTLLNAWISRENISLVNYKCVIPPSNACVAKYIYKYYINLPPINGGYIIAFQRCCRNVSITNIINPESAGATYWTYIPDKTQTFGIYNSSAVFKTIPPNFLCVNNDFIYDHSAVDIDGDSLSYELFTPFIGGNTINVRPRPPEKPPYANVVWQAPFNEQNMMNGLPELNIHPLTGLLIVKPRSVGQYVVGILTKEFRQGKLINTVRRDFQFNVLFCQFNLITSFAKNITSCNDTVSFVDNSFGAISYLWDFGVNNITTDTSTAKSPTYVYPSAGKYTVTLKIANSNCNDSLVAQLNILTDTIRFAGNDTLICFGNSLLLGTNDTAAYKYTWKPALFLNDSTLQRPTTTPTNSIQYIATRKSEFCTNTDTINIQVNNVKADFTAKTLSNCYDAQLMIDTVRQYPYLFWFLDGERIDRKDLETKKYQFKQTYGLQLVANDTFCNDTTLKYFTPTPSDSITLIPNVFTPNGDNINDCYYVKDIILNSDCNTLIIYNRWGHVMFDSKNDGACWNGNYNGKPAAEGVYFYILKSRSKDYHGTITLTREQ